MKPRSGTPPTTANRAEQMRQRLQAKTSGSSSGRRGGTLVAALPAPKAILAAGKSAAWVLWALSAVALILALAVGYAAIAVVWFLLHAGYFANFSRSDLALQVRVACLAWSGLGLFIPPMRSALYLALLAIVVTDLLIGYNVLERILFLIPANHASSGEDAVSMVQLPHMVELKWVVDIDEEKAQRIAAEQGCRWSTKLGETLADVDAVVIASATDTHFP
eukprot:s4054_g2.t1